MRAKEFLLEYNRQIAAKNISSKILQALIADTSVEMPREMSELANMINEMTKNGTIEKLDQTKAIEVILAAIELKDPTSNKQYTQWLARMYSKGNIKYEDLNRHNMIGMYEIGKKRKLIKPEHKDINKFKTYQEFENVMFNNYDLDEIFGTEEDETEKPQAKKVFENEEVLIVVPQNEAAACKYGKGTRWCTSAVHSHNYFSQYNRMGPLYILIPKRPQHNGEKYQIHFETCSFMDENDLGVDADFLLNKRFGEDVMGFFKTTRPELANHTFLMTKEELKPYVELAKDKIQELLWKFIKDWGINDDDYRMYLYDKGFVDDDGEIDWNRVEQAGLTYMEYNPNAKNVYNQIMGIFDDYDDFIKYGGKWGWTKATDMPNIIVRYLIYGLEFEAQKGKAYRIAELKRELGDFINKYTIQIVNGIPKLRYHGK